jgi:hypothetical protein
LDGEGATVFAETRFSKSGGMDIVGIPAGHYSVEMGSGASDVASSRYLLDAAMSGTSAVQNAPGASVSAFVQAPSASRTGSAVYLRLYNHNSGEDLVEAVPENGDVRFKKQAPPGEYEISLSNTDQGRFLFVKTIAVVGAKAVGRTVQIQDGTPVRLKITLGQGAGQLTGRLVRKDQPVVGAMIALVPMAPEHNRVLIRRGQTGSDGSFMIGGIVPGKYTIVPLEHGWDLDWWDPRVLKRYLGNGRSLEVEANGKYQADVNLDAP